MSNEESIEQSILKKLINFEDLILERKKEEAKENLIRKDTSIVSQGVFLLNSIVLGFSLGHISSKLFVTDVNSSFFYMIFLTILSILSSRYIYAFSTKNKTKDIIKKEIYSLKTLKDFKSYFLYITSRYKYHRLLFNLNNFELFKDNNKRLENHDMKGFINDLSKEEIDFIKEVLKKHSLKKNFSINFIDDIKRLCQKEKTNKRKEQQLLNNLKEIKDNIEDEEDDFLNAIIEESNIPAESEKKVKNKIDFKKIL